MRTTVTVQRIHARDAIAAATVWLPFLVFPVTVVAWWGVLSSEMTLRDDVTPSGAPSMPLWVLAVGVGVILVGVGFGAVSVGAASVGDDDSAREPSTAPDF